ncbi:MAG: T9SS type A sorting domain-containing protein [Flavobacteriaceae bacterium]|nr:T9SS type A sorting domain-containing protein [Flavobacteriaceae bacterium]
MTKVNSNLVWEFKNIQLVPSSVSQTLSSEYIYFKVKLNPGFQAGDIIPNTASIYFDSNPAIITNTFNTKFTSALSNLNFTSNDFTLYPNRANHLIYINLNSSSESISKISFYDVLGKNIKEIQSNLDNIVSVDISSFPKGIYLVEITTASNLKTTKKLVIN